MALTRFLVLEKNPDIDRPLGVVTIVVLGILSVATLFVAPVLIGAMVDVLGFSEAEAGYVISAELAGISLATFPAFYWAPRVNWRKAIFWALSVMIVLNLISAQVDGYMPLLTLRFLTGLAAGSATTICLLIIGLTKNTDRVFGLWVSGQLAFGTIGLYVLPSLFPVFGYHFVYLIVAVLIIGLLFLIRHLPQKGRLTQANEMSQMNRGKSKKLTFWASAGVMSIFIFYVGQYGVWAYMERIGAMAGLGGQNIGQALALATFLGIGGALTAAVLSARFGRFLPILVGTAVSIFAMSLLWGTPHYSRYILAACLFNFMFNFILPYLMAAVANVDITGRLLMLTNIASGAGLAAGPVLAANLRLESGYDLVIWVSIILTVLSFILVARLTLINGIVKGH